MTFEFCKTGCIALRKVPKCSVSRICILQNVPKFTQKWQNKCCFLEPSQKTKEPPTSSTLRYALTGVNFQYWWKIYSILHPYYHCHEPDTSLSVGLPECQSTEKRLLVRIHCDNWCELFIYRVVEDIFWLLVWLVLQNLARANW